MIIIEYWRSEIIKYNYHLRRMPYERTEKKTAVVLSLCLIVLLMIGGVRTRAETVPYGADPFFSEYARSTYNNIGSAPADGSSTYLTAGNRYYFGIRSYGVYGEYYFHIGS